MKTLNNKNKGKGAELLAPGESEMNGRDRDKDGYASNKTSSSPGKILRKKYLIYRAKI